MRRRSDAGIVMAVIAAAMMSGRAHPFKGAARKARRDQSAVDEAKRAPAMLAKAEEKRQRKAAKRLSLVGRTET
jgi:hypothetical protein